jgi:hypothetical protein
MPRDCGGLVCRVIDFDVGVEKGCSLAHTSGDVREFNLAAFLKKSNKRYGNGPTGLKFH